MPRFKSQIDPRQITRSLELNDPQLGVLRRVLSNLYLDPKVYSQTEARNIKLILEMVCEKHNETQQRLGDRRRLELANHRVEVAARRSRNP